ncbi:MAG: glycosyltransferase family 2 protein, partial [Nocardioidaceae bacterium]
MTMPDPRLRPPTWQPGRRRSLAARVLPILAVPLVLLYFAWLLEPSRVGNPILYGLLLAAELFNLAQAAGFWWNMRRQPVARDVGRLEPAPAVDVFVPVFDEPIDIVEPTIAAACAMHGTPQVALLDDSGGRRQYADLARRHGVRYICRSDHDGAKAGNINHALARTDAPYVAVFDCDHLPCAEFLKETLGHFRDPEVAYVQTPQYYANHDTGGQLAGAAWAQQALFFGTIATGKDSMGAMFCCGTNVVYRRSALEASGGLPQSSVTEDFELSITLHELGWRSVYVPQVLA